MTGNFIEILQLLLLLALALLLICETEFKGFVFQFKSMFSVNGFTIGERSPGSFSSLLAMSTFRRTHHLHLVCYVECAARKESSPVGAF